MDISIFDVVGPVMIGPSSSHTAGAARLGRIARLITGKPFSHVVFGLHGSFAKTYKGHGTDKALVAGVLGLMEYDERLIDSFSMAKAENISYEFQEIELDNVHENSVKITLTCEDGSESEIIGSSIGGGQIIICGINGFPTEFTANSTTLVIKQMDKKGIVSDVSRVLASHDINIGVMKLSRIARGDVACCIIETDSELNDNIIEEIRKIDNVLSAQALNLKTQGA